MLELQQMALILNALPDPTFVLTRSGKYVAQYGGRDSRYYHDGSSLVGGAISDLIHVEKAEWFLQQIDSALTSRQLLIVEYELSNRDVKGLSDVGPAASIWFEGRIQALDFQVDKEDVVLWVASNMSARHELEIKLKELSDTDQLSGLFNRRKLEQELQGYFELFMRYGSESSVVMFDLDNLKIINDNQGHHRGDELIQAVANVCRNELRHNDIACRLGGDEFVIALPNTDLSQAWQFARRLHARLGEALQDFSLGGVTASVSMGVATMAVGDQGFNDALIRADQALYQAKRLGKNQVVGDLELAEH